MKDNLDWVHHDSKTFDDERFMEEVIGRYVEKNTTHVKGYTKEFVDKLIEEKDKEIERLNNIINGMEKFFEYEYDNEVRPLNDRKISVWTICLNKLKELKESKNDSIINNSDSNIYSN